MADKRVPFEEAEARRAQILACVGAGAAAAGWLLRGSVGGLTVLALLTAYLMTGNRYQWIYIWRKTVRRDLIGLRVLLIMMFRMRSWERRGTTVVSRWAEVARNNPDKTAFVMDDHKITFRQGEELSNRVAWYFRRQGFKPGEVIALVMESQPEYPFLWLGLAKVGVVTALVNGNLRGAQLMHSIAVAGCRAVVFGDEMIGAIKEVHADLRCLPLFQYNAPSRESVGTLAGAAPLAAELELMPSEAVTEPAVARPRDTLLYIYTSGTTGLPKAAVITHVRYLLIASGVRTAGGLRAADALYCPLPLHHTAGGVLGAGQALCFGCTVALRRRFSASSYWADARRHGCTVAQYIGEICRYLLAVPPGAGDRDHGVRTIVGNGLRPQIWQQFVDRFGVQRVCEFYGATEGNSNLVNLDSKVGAIGFLSRLVSSIYPLMLVKCDEVTGEILRDARGRCVPCGPHEPGLFLGKIDAKKAILSFAGYADRAASEKKMVRGVRAAGDCYFNTGDILVMDHYGYFYFKDRTGDTFRWRGENVSTAEVEGVLSNLVGLRDSIVYGVAIPNVEGKAGMAAIADPERKLDLKALAEGLKSSLPAYARPLFIRVLPETPLTATFKLRKKDLMEQGFNIKLHSDPMYFMDQRLGEYVPLDEKLYDDIVKGAVRL